MIRTVLVAAFWLLLAVDAFAQGNICRTASPGSTAPNCASEDYVTKSINAIPGGGTVTEAKFTAGNDISLSGNCDITTSNAGSPCNIAASSALIGEIKIYPNTPGHLPGNYLVANGAAKSRSTFSALFAVLIATSTVTFTNGSAVIGWSGNTLSAGDKIKFFTTGSLPTNFTAGTHGYAVGTEYCVLSTGLTSSQFEVSASCGGSAIVAGSAGSGTQTAVNAPWGDGDGSTTFTLPNLVGDFMRFWQDGSGSVDANRAFGAEQLDAFQGHFHSATNDANQRNVTNSVQAGGSFGEPSNVAATVTIGAPTSDGVNGTPRTSSETRPRNQALLPIIRYQ